MSTCHNAFIESGNAVSRMAGSGPAGGDNITRDLVTRRIDHRVASLRAAVAQWVLLLRCVCLYALPCDAVFAADSAADADERAPGTVTISMPEAPAGAGRSMRHRYRGTCTVRPPLSSNCTRGFVRPTRGRTVSRPRAITRRQRMLTLFAGIGLWRGAAFYINPLKSTSGFGSATRWASQGFPQRRSVQGWPVEPLCTPATRVRSPTLRPWRRQPDDRAGDQ